MATVKYFPLYSRDPIVCTVDMGSTANTAEVGDWLGFSGKQCISMTTANAYFRASGVGIALDQNPKWTNAGSAYYLTAMPVGRAGGVYRVSGVTGAAYSAGDYVFPVQAGSGQVGQTGRTGKAALWSATAILPFLITALGASWNSASGVPNSAVGRILRVVAAGGTGQWDIEIFPTLFGFH